MPALELIAAALRLEPLPDVPLSLHDDLVATAASHGVIPLLLESPAVRSWAPALRQALKRAAMPETVRALGRGTELPRLIGVLDDAHVPALLIKGAHLSRRCYAEPSLRPHADIDVLVEPAARARAGAALEAAGYVRLAHVRGSVAFTQSHYWRDAPDGVRHAIDLHGAVAGPRAFAGRLTWAELYDARCPLPDVHAAAAGPSDLHALLLACIHRTAHHRNTDRLIWLYDIHALIGRLSAVQWPMLVALAQERGVPAVIADAFTAASYWLHTPVPAEVIDALRAGRTDPEVLAFLDPGHQPRHVVLSDWRALRGWRMRLRFLREHLLPDRAYMVARYGTRSRAALPFLYLHRVLTGAWRWL